jgi:two-component system chemotaxis response regulator CheY
VTIRVLVVEDSPAMRAFLRAALEDEGVADVSVAANGFEALRLLPRERFDVVVTDINMPDIHGLELLSFIRKSDAHRNTPVLIVSTEGSPRDRERGMALGANAYLQKPFEPEALRALVQRLHRERSAAQARASLATDPIPSERPPGTRGDGR